MPINFLHQNNFETDDDLIVEILEADKKFLQERKLDYLSLKKILKPNIFMSLKQQYINFAHLITKNAIAATFIMLIALTTVGASAAELLAPTEYKPSTQIQNLFGANKQIETDPYTALKPDQENDVASLDECDLSIKYPKHLLLNQEKLEITPSYMEIYPDSQILNGATLTAPEKLTDPENPYSAISQIYYLTFGCYQENYIPQPRDQANFSTEPMTKEEILDKFGWFITEAEMTDIKGMKFDDNIEMGTNYTGYNQITFKFENRHYFIHVQERNPKPEEYDTQDFITQERQTNGFFDRPGIFGNQVQFQFNSLVKNEANSEIQEKTQEEPKPEIQPLVANDEHDVVVIEKCDIAIRFPKELIFEESRFVPSPKLENISGDSAITGFSLTNSGIVAEVQRSILCLKGNKEYYPVAPRGTANGVLEKEDITSEDLLNNKINLKAGNFNFETAMKDVPCCGVNNEEWVSFKTKVNENTLFISDSFIDYQSDQFLIQIQQNSLAPSTPSVSLEDFEDGSSCQAEGQAYSQELGKCVEIEPGPSQETSTNTQAQTTNTKTSPSFKPITVVYFRTTGPNGESGTCSGYLNNGKITTIAHCFNKDLILNDENVIDVEYNPENIITEVTYDLPLGDGYKLVTTNRGVVNILNFKGRTEMNCADCPMSFIKTEIPVGGGHSGSPLFDSNGGLVGTLSYNYNLDDSFICPAEIMPGNTESRCGYDHAVRYLN